MRWILLLGALGLAGCRLGFDQQHNDAGAVVPTDAPDVPAAICKTDRIAVDATPAIADLAIGPTAEGYAAIWVDTAGVTTAHGVMFGPNHQLVLSRAMPEITDTRIGGVADVGQMLTLATATAGVETMRILDRDLTTMAIQAQLTNHVMGHDPYPSDAVQMPRAFLTATGSTFQMTYVATDGVANLAGNAVFTAQGPITDFACTDGPNHGHCAWAMDLSATAAPISRCIATDVSFAAPTFPAIPGGLSVSDDCHNVRNATGPNDSMLVVWTTTPHTVEAFYASSKNVMATIAPSGSAPKTVFDGARFWIAWLDGAGTLQLSSFELNGVQVNYALPGWTPIGPEAFELVRRGNETGLVVLSRDELDFLTICT